MHTRTYSWDTNFGERPEPGVSPSKTLRLWMDIQHEMGAYEVEQDTAQPGSYAPTFHREIDGGSSIDRCAATPMEGHDAKLLAMRRPLVGATMYHDVITYVSAPHRRKTKLPKHKPIPPLALVGNPNAAIMLTMDLTQVAAAAGIPMKILAQNGRAVSSINKVIRKETSAANDESEISSDDCAQQGAIEPLQAMLEQIDISKIENPMHVFAAMAKTAQDWWNKKARRHGAKGSQIIIEEEITRVMTQSNTEDLEIAAAVYLELSKQTGLTVEAQGPRSTAGSVCAELTSKAWLTNGGQKGPQHQRSTQNQAHP